jgi:predicted GNAT superfamily acetyltransferase
MQERSITRAVALVDIAMIGPAVMAIERDWGLAITPLEIMLLSAIVAAAFVAVEYLHQITLSQGTQ